MKINTQEFVEYLQGRLCDNQLTLWVNLLKHNPSLMGTNIDPKDNLCEVSMGVYERMIERSGKERVDLIEIGGGLPREGFYLLESGFIGKLTVIDKCEQEVAQTMAMAKLLGIETGVEAIQADLEKDFIEGTLSDLVMSRNFLYGAANSVREYMFEPGKRVYVHNQKVIKNIKKACGDLLGVVRIITNQEGSFNHKKAVREIKRAGFHEFEQGSLPLRRYSRTGLQIMYSGISGAESRESPDTKVDYVIGKKRVK